MANVLLIKRNLHKLRVCVGFPSMIHLVICFLFQFYANYYKIILIFLRAPNPFFYMHLNPFKIKQVVLQWNSRLTLRNIPKELSIEMHFMTSKLIMMYMYSRMKYRQVTSKAFSWNQSGSLNMPAHCYIGIAVKMTNL